MARQESAAWRSICAFCTAHGFDPEIIGKKAKTLLTSYRNLSWIINTSSCAVGIVRDKPHTNTNSILQYLNEFSANICRQQFESTVRSYSDIRCISALINNSLLKVRDFPIYGSSYYELLIKCFLSDFKLTEADLLLLLNMERSLFYSKKKEAITLFGCVLWGLELPGLIHLSSENSCDSFDQLSVASFYV